MRYARSGEVFVAYQVVGEGEMDIVVVGGFLTHLGVLWEEPGYRRWVDRLASFARVILFDKRGMGLSDRVQVGTLEERMDDVRAVMDAVGSERAALIGTSEGGPLSMLFAASYPERTRALLLVGGEVKEAITDDWPWGESTAEQTEDFLAALPERWGRYGLRPSTYAPSLGAGEAERAYEWSKRLIREASSPGRRWRSSGWPARSTSAMSAPRSPCRRSSCTASATGCAMSRTAAFSLARSPVPATWSSQGRTMCPG